MYAVVIDTVMLDNIFATNVLLGGFEINSLSPHRPSTQTIFSGLTKYRQT